MKKTKRTLFMMTFLVAAARDLVATSISVSPGDDIGAALERLRVERKPGDRAELVLKDGVYPLIKTI